MQRYNKKSLEDVCTLRWKELVYDVSHTRITQSLLDAIERDRNGDRVDRTMLQKIIEVPSKNSNKSQIFKKKISQVIGFYTLVQKKKKE